MGVQGNCEEGKRCIMADLIDRDIAYSVLEEYYHIRTEIQRMDLREALSRVPNGVVRCKECVYADSYDHCKLVGWWTVSDDFCSRGEKRKDGTND